MKSQWWWRALGGPYAVSWPVMLIPVVTAIPSVVLNARVGGMSPWTSALGQISGVALMLGTLLLARLTWLRPDRATPPGGVLVILTFGVASVARLIGLAGALGLLGALQQWPADVYIVSGGVGQLINLCIGAIVVNTVRAHAHTMARLESIRRQIEHARELTLEDVQRMQQEVAQEVLASARTLLAGVRSDSDVNRVAEAVGHAATDVVRSASHQMHSGQSVTQRISEPAGPARIRAAIAGVRPLAPVVGPILYVGLVSGAIWGWYGPGVALIMLVIATPLLIGGNFLLRRLWRVRSARRWSVAWLLLAYSLTNLFALVMVIGVTAAFGYTTADLVTGFAIYPVTMVIVSILFSVVEQQGDAERSLSKAVEDEAREMSRVLRMAEDERRRLARVMHGEMQAELTAAAAMLAAVPAGDEREISAVVDALMTRLSDVDLSGSAERRQTLAQLWDTWSLAIALDADITPEAQDLLTAEPKLQERVVPIVSEAITNAVRHGIDSGVTINLDVRDSSVWIEVRNRGVLATDVTGLGTVEIDYFAESWSMIQDGPEVVFTATVEVPSTVYN